MKYVIKRIGRSVEISEATSSLLVYRSPYQNLSAGVDEPIKIKNKFIVYILFGENNEGQDVIYVGKSTNRWEKLLDVSKPISVSSGL